MPRKKPIPRKSALTHVDEHGRVRMVDVGAKTVTRREAIARGAVKMALSTLDAIIGGRSKRVRRSRPRGSPASWRRKKLPELIPLCHQIALRGGRD